MCPNVSSAYYSELKDITVQILGVRRAIVSSGARTSCLSDSFESPNGTLGVYRQVGTLVMGGLVRLSVSSVGEHNDPHLRTRFYCFLAREDGKKREKHPSERDINQGPPVCLDWGSNMQLRCVP